MLTAVVRIREVHIEVIHDAVDVQDFHARHRPVVACRDHVLAVVHVEADRWRWRCHRCRGMKLGRSYGGRPHDGRDVGFCRSGRVIEHCGNVAKYRHRRQRDSRR